MPRKMLIAGNWKMNGETKNISFFQEISSKISSSSSTEILICPPTTLLAAAAEACQDMDIFVGGQDCHAERAGAHTGDISVSMLKNAGASHVIVGHSERRADHDENDDAVRAKAAAVLSEGMTPIICVGETLADRKAGRAEIVVAEQLNRSLPGVGKEVVVIAYEPVWAIGTGLTASLEDIAAMHACIRSQIPNSQSTQILYGGSVKPNNAADILGLDDVDGALVGGASLLAGDFAMIINAA